MVDIMTQAHRPVSELAPQVDRTLAVIVEGCLVKDRDHRIASSSELAERLAAVARRLGRAEDAAMEGPRRRSTDRLPPVRGVVGAFERPSHGQLGSRAPGRRISQRRVASAGLVGLLIGAAGVYALVGRGGGDDDATKATKAAEAVSSAPNAASTEAPVAQRSKNRAP
jgi:hypothetical protein